MVVPQISLLIFQYCGCRTTTCDCRQFEFVCYSPGKDMGIASQVIALLKHEYPSMIEESRSNKYFAKKWAHYDIVEDGEGMQLIVSEKNSG